MVESQVTSIDFSGVCITAVVGDAGEVAVTIGTQFLIASHSAQFQEIYNQGLITYWYGDEKCGWDGCTLTLATNISRNKSNPVPGNQMFAGIPIPFDIYTGDEITVCGSAYLDGVVPTAWTLGVALAYFNCSDYDQTNDRVAVTAIGSNENTNGGADSPMVCFNLSGEIPFNLYRCDAHLMLGFHVLGLTDVNGNAVRITYTLNIKRGCD